MLNSFKCISSKRCLSNAKLLLHQFCEVQTLYKIGPVLAKLETCNVFYRNLCTQKSFSQKESGKKSFGQNAISGTISNKEEFLKSLHRLKESKSGKINDEFHRAMQHSLIKLEKDLTLNDVVLFCDSLGGKNAHITFNEVIDIVIRKLCETENFDSYNTSAVVKAVHFSKSKRFYIRKRISNLVDFCVKNGDQLDIENFTHISDLLRSSALYCPHVLDMAFLELLKQLSNVRTKEMERILCALAYFDHKPRKGLNEVIAEFSKRNYEHIEYPLTLLYFIEHLCVFGHYPIQLIERCFDEKFVEVFIAMNMGLEANLLTINTSLAVECYGRCGDMPLKRPLKLEYETDNIENIRKKSDTERSNTEKELLECYLIMKRHFGNKVMFTRLLPFTHYPDIVLVNNSEMKSKVGREMRPAMIRDCTAVIVKHRNNYADQYAKQYRGLNSLKLRLLSEIGYKVIEIPFDELDRLPFKLNSSRVNCTI